MEVVVTALVLAASERPASALIADPNDPPAGRRLRACGEEQLACGADILPCLCSRGIPYDAARLTVGLQMRRGNLTPMRELLT